MQPGKWVLKKTETRICLENFQKFPKLYFSWISTCTNSQPTVSHFSFFRKNNHHIYASNHSPYPLDFTAHSLSHLYYPELNRTYKQHMHIEPHCIFLPTLFFRNNSSCSTETTSICCVGSLGKALPHYHLRNKDICPLWSNKSHKVKDK